MKSKATARFWKLYHQLPAHIRRLADKNYRLWRANPRHPSLEFKQFHGSDRRFSVRVGDHYRALAREMQGGAEWVWIGTHEDYSKLLGR